MVNTDLPDGQTDRYKGRNKMAERVDYNDLWKRINWIFQGRYEYRQKLGSGGMGLVFLVQATDLGRKMYALKVIDKKSPENRNIDLYAEIRDDPAAQV